ncbi:hypothetical protein LZ30DRAFT_773359 [Colletotrichum cereale]|nr:hypothetical protein LZ30DRAFT_773359 [Colletotrichum cereale]
MKLTVLIFTIVTTVYAVSLDAGLEKRACASAGVRANPYAVPCNSQSDCCPKLSCLRNDDEGFGLSCRRLYAVKKGHITFTGVEFDTITDAAPSEDLLDIKRSDLFAKALSLAGCRPHVPVP